MTTLTRRVQLVCDTSVSLSDENRYLERVFYRNNYSVDILWLFINFSWCVVISWRTENVWFLLAITASQWRDVLFDPYLLKLDLIILCFFGGMWLICSVELSWLIGVVFGLSTFCTFLFRPQHFIIIPEKVVGRVPCIPSRTHSRVSLSIVILSSWETIGSEDIFYSNIAPLSPVS